MGKYFPAIFKLDARRVVIAGGGELAARKARLVFGPEVSLSFIAPRFDDGLLDEWAGKADFHPREPITADFEGAAIAFVAEEDDARAEQLAKIARLAGVPLNVVDQPLLSDFYTPSIIDRGDVVVAISTGGAAPVLGRKLRAQIEALLPARLGGLAAFAKSFRAAVAANVQPARRRALWEQVFNGDIASIFLSGHEAAAKEAMLSLVNAPEKEAVGVVHIVGAGPGDPELLTLRALRLIQSADVILYDRLVGDDVLALARRDADRMYVGKAKAKHAVPQDKIEATLITLAQQGKNVVRLKGGDPFVFGRGGEELEAVRAAGIAVYVTPGVTAATGCAASVGMPLTHRDHAQAVTFVTGHAKGDADPNLDWQALAALGNTLVIYMGVGKARIIADRLMAHGRAPATPVAVIEKGTCTDEKSLTGQLKDLATLVGRGGVEGPALLVVGEVAALARTNIDLLKELERLSA